MQVDFYQLSRDPVDKVLPAIAARILSAGGRLLVVSTGAERLSAISRGLWDAGPDSFLANAMAGEGRDAIQPVLLSEGSDAVNGARHVAIADGLWRDEALTFDRAFYFFDAETIDGARDSWRTLSKREDVDARFWRQDGGKWVKMA